MADSPAGENGGPGEKEANKSPSPKPDSGTPPLAIKTDVHELAHNEREGGTSTPNSVHGAPVHRLPRRRVKDQGNTDTGKKRLATFSQQAQTNVAAGSKKNMVLSGDAMKEMARQAKATREERRSGLDGRHKYIISKVADAIGVEETYVEDQIVSDDRFELFDHFFEPNGAKKLMFYYQDAAPRESAYSRADVASVIPNASTKKLFLTNGDSEALTGVCYFFVRTITKPITNANIANEVNFGMIDSTEGGLLKGIEALLGKVMIPALRVQENWGALKGEDSKRSPVVDEFIESVEKFVNLLSTARISLEGKFELEDIDVGYNLDSFRSPAEHMQASRNSDLVEKLEGVVEAWCRQIDQVLAESEQMRKEADDIGPAAELEHWRQRMSKFNALLDEIKTPRVKTVVGIVHAAKSRCIRHWVTLDSRITDAANEAKDNVKYLYTLDKYFGPLSKCDPSSMIEVIPSLMNSIRMIHSISQYYNTSERMTSLFVKVTNQMITTCKQYINEGAAKIWDQDRSTVLGKIEDCKLLNAEYQKAFHRIKDKLKENPKERQFEFSENYIFGKFDTFCRRLDKLSEMLRTMHEFSGIHKVKIEGIESIAIKYQSIVTNTEKKKYDVLDHRKAEFDQDYNDFCVQIDALQQTLQEFLDTWFSKPLTTEYMLILMKKFESIRGAKLDTFDKYMLLISRFAKDLDNVKKAYQKMKTDPPIPRNLPPISGKIAWARQMYRRIEVPMTYFSEHKEVLSTPEGKRVVANYNKIAAVLLEFEVLYHKAWCKATELAKSSLRSSLLIRHPESKNFLVNLDPSIFEIFCEAKHLRKIGLNIPDAVYSLCLQEDNLRKNQRKLQELLDNFERTKENMPAVVQPCMRPLVGRVEDVILPGLTMLTWASMNFDTFIEDVSHSVDDLKNFTKKVSDILECRIEDTTDDIGMTALCDLPEDEAVTPEEFVEATEHIVGIAAKYLAQESLNVEMAVFDLIKLFEETLTSEEMAVLEAQGKNENFPNWYHGLMGAFCQKNTDSLVKCTRLSLDAIKRRLQQSFSKYQTSQRMMMSGAGKQEEEKIPLFRSNIILAIPAVVMRPSLEEIQTSLNKAIEEILKAAKDIPLWKHAEMQKQQQKLEAEAAKKIGEDPKMTKTQPQKPLYLQVTEHKDVVKVSGPLHTSITSLKTESDSVLETFGFFSELWNSDPLDRVKQFEEDEPGFTEYESQIRYYAKMAAKVEDIPLNYRVGAFYYRVKLFMFNYALCKRNL